MPSSNRSTFYYTIFAMKSLGQLTQKLEETAFSTHTQPPILSYQLDMVSQLSFSMAAVKGGVYQTTDWQLECLGVKGQTSAHYHFWPMRYGDYQTPYSRLEFYAQRLSPSGLCRSSARLKYVCGFLIIRYFYIQVTLKKCIFISSLCFLVLASCSEHLEFPRQLTFLNLKMQSNFICKMNLNVSPHNIPGLAKHLSPTILIRSFEVWNLLWPLVPM